MHQRLTRRQLAQIAIAGTAGVAIGTLANKTVAQQALEIVGVSSDALTSTDTTAVPEVDSTESDSIEVDRAAALARTRAARTNRGLLLQSLEVTRNNRLQNLRTRNIERGSASSLEVGERISDLTSLADGTLVGVINSISSSNRGASPTRLTFLGTSPTNVTVSGLNKNEVLENLLVLNDGSAIGLVASRKGKPPIKLVNVDVKTGAISNNNDFTLPANVRYSHLAQCPDGTIYTTSVGREGDTYLVLLDRAQRQPITVAQLRVKDIVWNNGLFSLTCSSAGQLLAFGAFWHETTKSVYSVDAKTGEMTRIGPFDGARITAV